MRTIHLLLAGIPLVASTAAHSADQLKFGKAPAWVVPQMIPADVSKTADAPVALLLIDQQMQLQLGKLVTYSEFGMKIQKPEGMSAGNISIPWNPATDTVTVNKLEIHRGGQIIDILAGGQKFTTMRRESGLEEATLDGYLTANIQPEGLQEGDIVDVATTIEHSDPVMGDHVEANFAEWPALPIKRAHVRLEWPASVRLKVQAKGITAQPVARGNDRLVEISAQDVQPIIAPKGAPARFSITRLGEATDFTSWADVARLMIPLYLKAETIPGSGPLRDEVEKIRASTTDPKLRAAKALQLVQDRVRYVALLMGQGGYVPADAETTWSRRFGDCKAKTALLLGILHGLDIEAEPLLVQSKAGDAVGERLPMIAYFDHVLVRTRIGGKTVYLDGTRTGDTNLDDIEVPNFGWGLPVVAEGKLVSIVPSALNVAQNETRLDIDASAGIYASAPANAEQIIRGDLSVVLQSQLAALGEAQRREFFDSYWKKLFDFVTYKSGTTSFDKAKRELRFTMTGDAKLDWSSSYFHVPNSTVGYNPDFDRSQGPFHDAPFAVGYPDYAKTLTRIRLPQSFITGRQFGSANVHETVAGIEYNRTATLTGNLLSVETTERSLVPEIPATAARTAEARLRALADEDVALPLSSGYRATPADVLALAKDQPGSAKEYVRRGSTYLDAGKLDEAIADFTQALANDPKNVWALADRAVAYVWKHDYERAANDLKAAAAIDPANAVISRAKALQAEIQRNYPQAIEFYSKSLETEPDNSFALLHRANAYLMQGKPQDALRDLNAALARAPSDPDTLAARAVVEASLDKLDDAKKDIASAKAIKPDSVATLAAQAAVAERDPDAQTLVDAASKLIASTPLAAQGYSQRAAGLYRLGRYKDALADTDQALKLGFNSTQVRVLRANIFKLTGDDDSVRKEAEAMIRENPDSDFAYVAAAKTYAALGRRDDAMRAFDKALAIKPQGYIYINRAQIRPLSDDADRTADYDAALKLDPNDPDALAGKADILARRGKYAEAADLYEQAIKAGPDRDYLSLDRAALLYKGGRTAEAQKLFADARAKASSPTELNHLCWTKATAGIMLESALQDCRDALKLKPDSGAYLDSLGMVLLKLGKLDEALTAYDQAIAKKTGADSLMGRALVYARKGDRTRADADATAARKINVEIDAVFAAEYGLKL